MHLQRALEELKSALGHINDTRKQTEDRVHLFEIFNDIENLPVGLIARYIKDRSALQPEIVSAHRVLITSIDAIDVSAIYSKRRHVTLFLFNDSLVVSSTPAFFCYAQRAYRSLNVVTARTERCMVALISTAPC